MELNHHDHAFLEELLGFRSDQYWEQPILSPAWNDLDYFLDPNQSLSHPPNTTSSCEGFSVPPPHQDLNHNPFTGTGHDHAANSYIDTPSFGLQEEPGFFLGEDLVGNFEALFQASSACKVEPTHDQSPEAPLTRSPSQELKFHIGSANEPKSSGRAKNKPEGHISKNLMAERRRRKRLNDRLSMLRSIVPKISKMDRTSILGDTIDYMKELLERINNLQQGVELGNPKLDMSMSTCKDGGRPNGVFLRNSPKFDVERRNGDTQIEISCADKPDLLLSTVSTLEALGLEIQQCVISCFSDFAMQASCSQELDQRGVSEVASSEDIKQILFRNAGYGGKCL